MAKIKFAIPIAIALSVLQLSSSFIHVPILKSKHKQSTDLRRHGSDSKSMSGVRRTGPLHSSASAASGGLLWRRADDSDVLLPAATNVGDLPVGVIHFVGGAAVGAAPRIAYRPFLEALAQAGFLVVATPIMANTFDHRAEAMESCRQFRSAWRDIEDLYGPAQANRLPQFGLGHSLGAKLIVLSSCLRGVGEKDPIERRRANVLISFNNFSARESVPLLEEIGALGKDLGQFQPLLDQFSGQVSNVAGKVQTQLPRIEKSLFSTSFLKQGFEAVEKVAPQIAGIVSDTVSNIEFEFSPDPEEMWQAVEDQYPVKKNLIIQFKKDSIDQSPYLSQLLDEKLDRQGTLEFIRLDGNHLTPVMQDIQNDWFKAQPDWTKSKFTDEFQSLAMMEFEEMLGIVINFLRENSVWQREQTW